MPHPSGYLLLRGTGGIAASYLMEQRMGAHYGSVQIKTENRERVKAVAEQVASTMKIRLLVGPPVNGWIGLYPESNGQDENVGREIARQIDSDVLHMLVHDDDIFAYWLFRDGKQVDSFHSKPGYFGEENRAQEEQMSGNPEAFRPLIGDKVSQLPAILERGESQGAFASEQLEQFAKVLRIPGALNAYEYMKEGDRNGIKGWRKFEEILEEQVVAEGKQKKQARSRVSTERNQLKSASILLLSDEREETIAYGSTMNNGFAVAWPHHFKETVSFNTYQEPWDERRPLELQSPSHITGVASDASGNRIAMAAGDRVRVWDISAGEWNPIADVLETDLAVDVAVSADGKRVAHASRKEVVVTELGGGKRLCAFLTSERRQIAFHPSGEWLAMAGNTLGLISLDQQPNWRDLYIGGKSNGSSAVRTVFQLKMKNIDLDALEKKHRASMDASLLKFQQIGGAKKTFPEEQLETMRQSTEKYFDEFRSRLRALKEGTLAPAPPQAREPVIEVGFSRDGRWLWCSTHWGLRIYDWSTVPRESGATMPPSTRKFALPGDAQMDFSQQINAIAEERDAPAVVFGGGTGRLYRMDLSTGETRELIKLPGDVAVYGLAMSIDGKTLGVASRTVPTPLRAQRAREQRYLWEVWSYPRLRGPFSDR